MSARLAILGALVVSTGACWVPIEQGRALESDLVKLKAEVAAQHQALDEADARAGREREKQKADLDAALRRIDSKVKEVGEALDALNRAARKTGADLGVDLERAQAEVARLRGLVEEVQAKSQATDTTQADLATRLAAAEAKLAGVDEAKKAAEAAAAAAAAKEAEEKRKLAERPQTKEAFYDLAKGKLDAGQPAEARKLFAEFLTKYKDETLSPAAQYWLAETHYAEKHWRDAVFEFQKVRDGWPKSDKASDALLKVGFCFIEMGLTDESQSFLEEVQKVYPKSNAAKLAAAKLAELRKKK